MTFSPGSKVRVVRGPHRGRLGTVVDHVAMLRGLDSLLLPSPSASTLRKRYQVADGELCIQLDFEFTTGAPRETAVIAADDLRTATRFQSGL